MSRSLSTRSAHRAGLRRGAVFSAFANLYGVWRQRRKLADLDDAALRDIGLTRSEAEAEARRRFWDAPGHWQR